MHTSFVRRHVHTFVHSKTTHTHMHPPTYKHTDTHIYCSKCSMTPKPTWLNTCSPGPTCVCSQSVRERFWVLCEKSQSQILFGVKAPSVKVQGLQHTWRRWGPCSTGRWISFHNSPHCLGRRSAQAQGAFGNQGFAPSLCPRNGVSSRIIL